MNRIFKLIWDAGRRAWVVGSELAKTRTRSKARPANGRGSAATGICRPPPPALKDVAAQAAGRAAGASTAGSAPRRWPAHRPALRLSPLCLLLGLATIQPPAQATELPQGGSVVLGEGSIQAPDGRQLVIDQRSGKLAIDWQRFDVGAGNRVTFRQPGADAVALNRVLGSDGSRILGQLEANGRVFLINPNGILFGAGAQVDVGALVASTLDLSNEDFAAGRYRFRGEAAPAQVLNLGRMTAADGGAVALLGGSVINQGVIGARLGTVALAAGRQITLDFAGDGLLRVQVDEGLAGALADNRQLVQADGGTVLMTAAAGDALLQTVVNNSGVIEARSLGEKNGRISLQGGEGDGSRAQVAGTVDASGWGEGEHGGEIAITGRGVELAGATVDAAGSAGGGRIRVGGDWQGGGELARAGHTTVDAASALRADAIDLGDGGSVVLWSEEHTDFRGKLSARGGSAGGDGGSAEVSSRGLLGFDGAVDMGATAGQRGSLLLDPRNVTIAAAGASNSSSSGGVFSPTGDNAVINTTALSNALATADVTVTTGGSGSQAGDITVASSFGWTSTRSLTLSASRDIVFAPGVVVSRDGAGGNLTLRADSGGNGTGTVSFGSGARVAFSGGAGEVRIYYNPADYTAPTDYAAHIGAPLASYMLVNSAADLQAIPAGTGAAFALGRDVDASATAGWNGGAGFMPLSDFGGTLDGLGHRISGLAIARSGGADVGLIGNATASAHVRNLTLEAVNIAGGSRVGALAGRYEGGEIAGVHASGTVGGEGDYVGGLVGLHNQGSVRDSSAEVAVTLPDALAARGVGGLLGASRQGTLNRVHASGEVRAAAAQHVGGLIGENAAAGAGQGSTVDQAYASGAVRGGDAVGGLAGLTEGAAISRSYALGQVSASGVAGGLVGVNAGSVSLSYATGSVSGATAGALVGNNGSAYGAGAVGSSYWDSYTNPVLAAVGSAAGGSSSGLASVTSDPAQSGAANYAYKSSAYAAFDFNSDWWSNAGATRPMGRWEYATDIRNAHQLQLMSLNLAASYRLARDFSLPAYSQSGMWTAAGFLPVGGITSNFSGRLDGGGHTVDQLRIARPGATYVGLFGATSAAASIANLVLTQVDVAGGNVVGAVVGFSNGAVRQVVVDGTVSGAGAVGGVAGFSGGTVADSGMRGAVTAQDSAAGLAIGGLVGTSTGQLSRSWAEVAVSGSASKSDLGGLVGYSSGSVSQSWSRGSVSGGSGVGGLVGEAGGSILQSASSASVAGNSSVGGLVGIMSGVAISDAYASGGVSGGNNVGGLAGLANAGSITRGYAAGPVSASGGAGGLVGSGSFSASASFWDMEASGRAQATAGGSQAGVSGLTTAQAQSLATYAGAGWNVDAQGGSGRLWRIYEGHSRPLLRAFLTPLTVTGAAGSLTTTYDGNSGGAWAYTTSLGELTLGGQLSYTAATPDAGSYSTAAGTLTISDDLYSGEWGYDILYAGTSGASLTIMPRPIVVSANGGSSTAGEGSPLDPGLRADNLAPGEDESVLAGLRNSFGLDAGSAPGLYVLTVEGELASGNYLVVQRNPGLWVIRADVGPGDVSIPLDPTALPAGVQEAQASAQQADQPRSEAVLPAGLADARVPALPPLYQIVDGGLRLPGSGGGGGCAGEGENPRDCAPGGR